MDDIDPQTVCFIAAKARAFDAKVEVGEAVSRGGPAEDDISAVLEDRPNDSTYAELKHVIDDLNVDQQVELVALTWLGRGDFTPEEWGEAIGRARDARTNETSLYLMGIPLLSDYLEEGLSALGYSCEDYQTERV